MWGEVVFKATLMNCGLEIRATQLAQKLKISPHVCRRVGHGSPSRPLYPDSPLPSAVTALEEWSSCTLSTGSQGHHHARGERGQLVSQQGKQVLLHGALTGKMRGLNTGRVASLAHNLV